MSDLKISEKKSGHLYNNVSFFNRAYLSYLLFSAQGRINRKKYIAGLVFLALAPFSLILLIGGFFLLTVALLQGTMPMLVTILGGVLFLLYMIIYIGMIYAQIVIVIKRLHDLNKSGWFVLLGFLPPVGYLFSLLSPFFLASNVIYLNYTSICFYLISLLFWIYLLFFKGTEGDNQYGPPAI